MNDFDWDVLQKKRIARGAAHMKRGSKSKKCSLPSDHLTQAEWKRRNGAMNTYNMASPMTWEDFKAMPRDLQAQYIYALQSRFNVTLATISVDLFGRGNTALHQLCSRHGIRVKNMRGKKLAGDERSRWINWLHGTEAEEPVVEEPVVEEPVVEEPVVEEPVIEEPVIEEPVIEEPVIEEPAKTPNDFVFTGWRNNKLLSLTELSATFRGEFEPTRFLTWIAQLPIPEGEVKIKVEVEAV